jgi:hypothetical protein
MWKVQRVVLEHRDKLGLWERAYRGTHHRVPNQCTGIHARWRRTSPNDGISYKHQSVVGIVRNS